MVKHLILIALLMAPIISHAITPDEVRAIDDEASRTQKAKAARVIPGNVDQLLPAPPSTTNMAPTPPSPAPVRASKYAPAVSTVTAPDTARTTSTHSETILMQPSGYASQATTRVIAPTDAIRTEGATANVKKYFGIPFGTWVHVSLNRNVSNAESGQVELTLVDDVAGTRRTLPAGTLLYAEKTYNQGTKRLDCHLMRGITPHGYEFTINGLCYDGHRVAGLNGIVNINEQAMANKGFQRGALSALRAAAGQVPGAGGIAAQGIQGAADSVINDSSQVSDQAAAPAYTIYVSPQTLLIRVDDSL